ncbi:MAG: DUF1993 domain-containing protein [Alphaproteobacteria bacterium]
MTLSLHRITVPVYDQMLTNLDFVLDRGADFAAEKGLEEGELLERRCAPDMFTLGHQVDRACFHARQTIATLADIPAPALPEALAVDISDARARIADTLDFIRGVAPDAIDGDPAREVTITVRLGDLTLPAIDFVLQIAQAQVYFHCTTAYDLLRAEGVQIGKIDFLGKVMKDAFQGK